MFHWRRNKLRCSCCICHRFDDNKDPSLWLVCNSDPPHLGDSCGSSCHLMCALKHDRAGINKKGCYAKLDGCYYCVSCRKVNGLMGCWLKQLTIAKDARRVDILCSRISLSHKILKNTEKYKDLHAIVNMAIKKLKKEVGPLDRVSAKMARGIVNRLTCGSEVQKLCAYAIEASNKSGTDSPALQIRFEDISPVSIVVILDLKDEYSLPDIIGCKMWHRKGTENDYPDEPTCLILKPDTMFMLSGLDPSTEYHFKVSPFSSTVELGTWEARWVTQTPSGTNSNSSGQSSESEYVNGDHSSSGNEAQETGQPDSQKGSTNSSNNSHAKVMSLENIIDVGRMAPSKSIPPTTPHKSEESKGAPDPGNLDSVESKYEYCVKVIRWLECEGFMEKEFRVKFLTWFSLKATAQERRVVKAFIDVLIDEPESLVSQLNDAFMEGMCNKEKPMVPSRRGFCTRLWH
ncbi:VIN3-like protein 2 [Acorus gramineus]|uniref:VIN3-like protein 2 n=1 Tax=Acorus gramineus TaxID=55184 RepID=A0AAV9BFM4_ACOGR|nr:VIN3-like protein 2 [Acorus gramineus]